MEFDKKVIVDVDGVIETGKQFDLDLKLPEDDRNVVYGIIKDHKGKPVADAVVKLVEVCKDERKPVSHTFTDKEGEFVFGPLCPHKSYAIEIWVNRVKHVKICKICEHEGRCLKGIDLHCEPHFFDKYDRYDEYDRKEKYEDYEEYGNYEDYKKDHKDDKYDYKDRYEDKKDEKYDDKYEDKKDDKYDDRYEKKCDKKYDDKYDDKKDDKYDDKYEKKCEKKYDDKYEGKKDDKYDDKYENKYEDKKDDKCEKFDREPKYDKCGCDNGYNKKY